VGVDVRQRFDHHRDRVVAQRREVPRVEPSLATRRDKPWIDRSGQVLASHESLRAQGADGQRDHHYQHAQGVDQPAGPPGQQEHHGRYRAESEPRDGRVDVEAELGPAVGVLVQLEAQSRRGEDDESQAGQGDRRGEIGARAAGDHGLETGDQAPRQEGDRDQLEEAAPCVLAVGHARRGEGVAPTEQVRELEAHEDREQQVDGR